MLTLTINGESRTLSQPQTLAELIDQLGYDRRRIAVEINRELVPQTKHTDRRLAAGDELELVQCRRLYAA